jgi:[ribosomal protein S18]-alanine N-acetyltransferase
MGAVIRTLTVDDLEPLHALEVAAQPLPWSDDQLLLELVNDNATVLGMLDSEHGLIAHVVMRRMVDELWVLNICVHPDHRRHGHARALLDSAMQHGRAKLMTSLWLEVREGNAAARALYASLGLAETAKRPEYYPPIPPSTTRETAVLMSRSL